MMGKFTNFVATLTGTSTGKTAEAHHDARRDSGVHSGRDTDSFKSAPEWADKQTSEGRDFFPSDKK